MATPTVPSAVVRSPLLTLSLLGLAWLMAMLGAGVLLWSLDAGQALADDVGRWVASLSGGMAQSFPASPWPHAGWAIVGAVMAVAGTAGGCVYAEREAQAGRLQ